MEKLPGSNLYVSMEEIGIPIPFSTTTGLAPRFTTYLLGGSCPLCHLCHEIELPPKPRPLLIPERMSEVGVSKAITVKQHKGKVLVLSIRVLT